MRYATLPKLFRKTSTEVGISAQSTKPEIELLYEYGSIWIHEAETVWFTSCIFQSTFKIKQAFEIKQTFAIIRRVQINVSQVILSTI